MVIIIIILINNRFTNNELIRAENVSNENEAMLYFLPPLYLFIMLHAAWLPTRRRLKAVATNSEAINHKRQFR